MKKSILTLLTCVCVLLGVHAQSCQLELSWTGQLHDYRGTGGGSKTKHWSENLFGTNAMSLALKYKIIENENYDFSVGLGGFHQRNTTYTGFNSVLAGIPPRSKGFYSITKYNKTGLIVPISFSYDIDEKWLVGVDLVNQFVINRHFVESRNFGPSAINVGVNGFTYEQGEVSVLGGKRFGSLQMLLSVRLLRFARVDRYIFFEEYFDGVVESRKPSDIFSKTIDVYNPLKVGVTLRYDL